MVNIWNDPKLDVNLPKTKQNPERKQTQKAK